MATITPYPVFVNALPIVEGAAAMPAVGRCRIHPETCAPSMVDEFRSIVEKSIEQASVDDKADSPGRDERKKMKKKYMKQGVAMAKSYLTATLGLDVSIVDIEVVLSCQDLLDSAGLLASCFLDAGCDRVVSDGSNLEALDAAKIPRDRLVANFEGVVELIDAANAGELAATICVTPEGDLDADSTIKLIKDISDAAKEGTKLGVTVIFNAKEGFEGKVGDISRQCYKQNLVGNVGIIDPSVQQLGSSYAACIRTDRADGLYTTVVCTRSGEALGLVYSSKESVVAALESGRGVYYSRSRNGLWRKGDTSGHYQTLHRIDVDCDGDALRFSVTQKGDDVAAFCHLNTLTCWGDPVGLRHLEGTLKLRLRDAPEGSYTKRLFDDETLLRDKLVEEAQELSEANDKAHVAEELADVLYFAMVRAAKAGVSIDDAAAELDRRARKVTRRKGDSKVFRIEAGKKILQK